jgi:hypothetical protein
MNNETNSMALIIKELERVFDYFAPRFQTPEPMSAVITIQTKGRMNCYGLFTSNRWQADYGSKLRSIHEINLSAEYLARGPFPVIETLIHEMVHLANYLNKIKDCSRAQYHNKKFKDGCDKINLICIKTPKHGWSQTELSEALTSELKTQVQPNEALFAIFRREDAKVKAPTKMKKWECGCTIVRCATDLNAKCISCEEKFVNADGDAGF